MTNKRKRRSHVADAETMPAGGNLHYSWSRQFQPEGRADINVFSTNTGTIEHIESLLAPANGEYPANPNGSVADVAGICNPAGNVLGLMPHPENNVVVRARDGEARRERTRACLALWRNGVEHANGL